MPCNHVTLPGGLTAIVCTRTKRCACGNRAPLLCDWKVGDGKTCDKPICGRCSYKPAMDRTKDLCPEHAKAYHEWRKARGV